MSTTQIDATGAEHPPAGPQARILSLVPSLTELLFALGLGLQVVGRTMYCVHPEDRVEGAADARDGNLYFVYWCANCTTEVMLISQPRFHCE